MTSLAGSEECTARIRLDSEVGMYRLCTLSGKKAIFRSFCAIREMQSRTCRSYEECIA
jgi:hypothetical protein